MKNLYKLLPILFYSIVFGQKPTLPKDYLYYNALNSATNYTAVSGTIGFPYDLVTMANKGTQSTETGRNSINNAIRVKNNNTAGPSHIGFSNLVSKFSAPGNLISFWYKHIEKGHKLNYQDHKFFGIKRSETNDTEAISLGIDSDNYLTLYTYRRSGNTQYYYSLPTRITDITEDDMKVWRHYMIETEGATIKLYVDNVLKTTLNNGVGIFSMPVTPIHLGGLSTSNNLTYSNTVGDFDSFLVYNRLLTSDEKTQIYNFSESNRKLHYDFNKVTHDLYGNSYAFTLARSGETPQYTANRDGKADGAILTQSQFNSMPTHPYTIYKDFAKTLADGFTFTSHFKLTSATNTVVSHFPIATLYNVDTPPAFYKLFYMLGINKTTRNIEVVMDDVDNVRHTFATSFKVNVGEWNVVTTTLFGNTLKIFCNGDLIKTQDLSAITRNTLNVNNAMDFARSMYMLSEYSSASDAFIGAFDDIIIDKDELTDTQVASLYTGITGLVPPSLGVSVTNAKNTTTIYPNPVSDTFRISNLKADSIVDILDVTGKIISSSKIDSDKEINVQNLKSGVYIVRIQNGSEITTKKIIKK